MYTLSVLLAATLIAVSTRIVVVTSAQDFQFIRISETKACVKFRTGSSISTYSVVRDTPSTQYISKQSAQFLCKMYYPTSSTGVLENFNGGCYSSSSTTAFNDLRIDCPYNATSASSCNLTGSYATSSASSFYGVAISCVVPTWSSSSTTSSGSNNVIVTGGGNVSKEVSVMIESIKGFSSIRPSSSFSYGTLCIDNSTTTPSKNLLNALCRTADSPSTNSTFMMSSTSISTQMFLSNIQCTDSDTASLWNGGCTYDTHYYDEPQNCIDKEPLVKCSNTFDMKLGAPIPAAGNLNGFQMVLFRQQGLTTDIYDGIACLSTSTTSSTAKYFANSVCEDIYGAGEFHFAAAYTSSVSDSTITKLVINAIACSSGASSLSQCYGSLISPLATPCTTNRGIVSCMMNELNTRFSLDGDTPGRGHLLVAVAAPGQNARTYVCSNGFDQAAALAACRSVGYTPGFNATYTVATATSYHAINNVDCPSGANKLTDCKLQYSGTGYKISSTARSVCSGRVYLDCGLAATPSIQFRTTPSPNYYLQARLFANSDWGWVETGSGVSSYEANIGMCSKVTSITGDPNITGTYLSVSSCPNNVSSYKDCTYAYENGAAASTGFSCSSSYIPSSAKKDDENSANGLDPDIAIGLGAAGGAIVLIVIIVVLVVCCKMAHRRRALANARAASGSVEQEMSLHRTTTPAPTVPSYDYNSQPVQQQQPAQTDFYASSNAYSNNPPPTAGGGLYGNTSGPVGGLFGMRKQHEQQQQQQQPQQGLYQDGKSSIY